MPKASKTSTVTSTFWRLLKKTVLCVFVAFTVGFLVWVCQKPPLLESYDFGTEIYDRHGKLIRLTTAKDERYRNYVPFEEISKHVVDATLLYEDRYFWYHPGVNIVALVEAAIDTYFGSTRRGASTITMQLARMKFGIDSKSPVGKIQQILAAIRLEVHYTKEEILEAYLNLAPYGGNVEGIKAASLIYFGKEPKELTWAQSILLSTIPQNPGKRRPGPDGKETDSMFEARQRLGQAWIEEHPDTEAHQLGLGSRFDLGLPSEIPFISPHATTNLMAQDNQNRRLETTIDLKIQKEIKKHISDYVDRRRSIGINNAAAMLLNHNTNEVIAVVGSADFFDPEIDGQVNAATAKRSPGSALKPFVYALAIDQGLIHPSSLLKDSPVSFADYTPSNFDKNFKGPLSATDALVRSRNIPAVRLASKLQGNGLQGLLQTAGVQQLRTEQDYGLPIVLGGVEVTMEEMGGLYAALKNGGFARKVTYVKEARSDPGTRIMSSEAAFLTTEMLKENQRPGQRFKDEWTRDSAPIAWKTGTSPGMRDAWSAGIVGPYVLVVWVGQFMGGQSPIYVGRRAAAPLFFEIADSLRSRGISPSPIDKNELNIARVDVCSTSGSLPGPHCPHTKSSWFIPGISPIDKCTIHQQIEIYPRTGNRVCPEHAGQGDKEVFELWPSDLASLFKEAGLPRKSPPPFQKQCALVSSSPQKSTLEITSPKNRLVYAIRTDNSNEEKVPFSAVSDADARALFWFVDGAPIGRVVPGETLLWRPKPGNFQVAVLDDRGRSDSRSIRIELVE